VAPLFRGRDSKTKVFKEQFFVLANVSHINRLLKVKKAPLEKPGGAVRYSLLTN
jgi:hypothetical protein